MMMYLPLANVDINLAKMTASYRSKGKGNMKVVKLEPQMRVRNGKSKKADGLVF